MRLALWSLPFLAVGLVAAQTPSPEQSLSAAQPKHSLLIHVTQGPENPTRAALAFLVAKTAVEEGHSVSLFLAGDAVQLMRDEVLDRLSGLGTGFLRESFTAIIRGGGRFYVSTSSSQARGVTEAVIKNKAAEFATPAALVRLTLSHYRTLTY